MNRIGCRYKQVATSIIFGCLCIFYMGCAAPAVIQNQAPGPKAPEDPVESKTVTPAPSMQQQIRKTGSLWVDNGSLSQMFINAKARQIGDIVTIKIVESSSATNNAKTNTGRTTAMSVGLNNFFGLENRFPSTSNFFNPFSSVQSNYGSQFDGSGSTARSGALTAYISARIVQILPNGNLVIEGNREVRVNNENQIITLTGVVRPRDITPENIVQSTYIADARISYSGSGVLNDQQRPGWLARILDNIWPF